MSAQITLTAIDGLLVGHAERDDRPTGCTVVLAQRGAVAGVAVRGAAPGTRETDLLRPENTVQEAHAVLMSGGSAFGLAAAQGVVDWLRGRDVGYRTGAGPVPIVPAAILYDLGVGESGSYPGPELGRAACEAASSAPVPEGSLGAGAGATVGKMIGGGSWMKGGVGSAGYRFDDGTIVAALVAVNCRGDVRDPETGEIIAGARREDGRGFRDIAATLLAGAATDDGGSSDSDDGVATNTTIGVVATNRTLTQAECTHLASVAHDGIARAVTPAHTRGDGDTLFFLSTGAADPPTSGRDWDRIEVATAAAVAHAIARGVRAATGLPGIPSVSDLGVA